MKTELKCKYWAVIAAVFIFGLFQATVLAQATSTIRFSYVGAGIEFKIYKVGEISSHQEVTLAGDFSKYSVSFEDSEAAQTLAAYVLRDDISPDATSITNSDYEAVFSGLSRGVYLITGDRYTTDKKRYTALPVIVSVLNDDGNRNISVTGKYEVKDISTGGGGGGGSTDNTTEVSVLKVWKGSTNKSDVTVQLLRDGVVYNEVVLNSKNNWRNTWEGLNDSYSWTVVEKTIVDGYKVSIEKDGTVFIITNTYTPPDTPEKEETTEVTEATTDTNVYETTEATTATEVTVIPNTPDEPNDSDTPPSSSGDEPGVPSDSDIPDDEYDRGNTSTSLGNPKSDTTPPPNKESSGDNLGRPSNPTDVPGSGNEKLPQTGQLWWPVPVLAFIGILFIIIGIGYRREEECL